MCIRDRHNHFGNKKKNNVNLKDDDHDDHTEEHTHEHTNNPPEITAFLVTTKSPIANINFPRFVNKEPHFKLLIQQLRLPDLLQC